MQPVSSSPVRLYCFPHAGATSLVYRGWQPLGEPHLSVRGVDAPGRGTRRRERKAAGFHALVRSMAEQVVADLLAERERTPGLRWATFGHSFGATMSLAVAAAVARQAGAAPVRAVLSGAVPPRLQRPGELLASVTDEELLTRTAADGGTPPAVLADPTMSRILLRMLREDDAVRAEFAQEAAGLRVDFPLTLIAAQEDVHAPPEKVWPWSAHSSAQTCRVGIEGGHFAAVQNPKDTLTIIADATGAGER
ncbi:thioesterase domain-containing protein [Streptomyces sp. RB6PN25]|uniref:Thioesterase domain-containing protein n=1 Tax=Streptomyces humicola TaxID=2953240 RepID=A0ABT1Q2V3_9ACTN|nr:thioesterase domain-containing protein [Streptomyces humicola]MCQ4083650.1 thioesterase domain-containing protein [Streptomyces humicola]